MPRTHRLLADLVWIGLAAAQAASAASPNRSPTYVNIFWNQHQPSYLHSLTGRFEYPFTRIHAVRDYYSMAAMLIHGRNDYNSWEIQDGAWVDTGAPTGRGFPFVHLTINLSAVLLHQIETYVEALAPAFDGARTAAELELALYPNGDPSDPSWNDDSILLERVFDLLVKPQANFTTAEKTFLLYNSSYITPREAHVFLFPGYAALEEKRLAPGGSSPANWTDDEMRDFKVWYALTAMHTFFKETDAYPLVGLDEDGRFITDLVEGVKTLGQFKTWGTAGEEFFGASGETLDPMDLGGYAWGHGAEFILDGHVCRHFTDQDALHVALMQYRIMKHIVPVHRLLQAVVCPQDGYPQVEVVTTPYSHPILPLVYDTDNYLDQSPYDARVDAVGFAPHGLGEGQTGQSGPGDPNTYPDDVYNQVAKGAEQYIRAFGRAPHGMWPGEGALGESVVYAFRRNGVKWISSGNETCLASGHVDDTGRVYRIDEDDAFLDGDNTDAMSAVFRSEQDMIALNGGWWNWGCGWGCDGDAWAQNVMNRIIVDWGHEKFWTHCADGENAWGWFHRLGATFFESTHRDAGTMSYGLYYRINRACSLIPYEDRWYREYDLVSATPSSYIGIRDGQAQPDGHHPLDAQYELEPLAHGSWVFGNLETWMGEENEIQAWIHLRQTRLDLAAAGGESWLPNPYAPRPTVAEGGRQAYFEWKAWESLYEAEGSDPFWWYGTDQSFGSDEIFDDLFREILVSVYVNAMKAGRDMAYPVLQVHPIISPIDNCNSHHAGGPATDEDYVHDPEPPNGHGDPILVPPITRDPVIDPGRLPADGRTPAVLQVFVFEDPRELSEIDSVTVDLRPIGGPRRAPLHDDGDFVSHGDLEPLDGVYSTVLKAVPGTPPGRVVLTLTATDTDEAWSVDFAELEVTAAPELQLGIPLAGFWSSRAGPAGRATVAALASGVIAGDRPARVALFWAGPTAAPLAQPVHVIDLAYDGNGIWWADFAVPPGAAGEQLYRILALEADGTAGGGWPALAVPAAAGGRP